MATHISNLKLFSLSKGGTKIFTSILLLILVTLSYGQDGSCIPAIINTILEGPQQDRMAMLVATGKMQNDLGQYDFCNNNRGTTYATLSVPPLPVYLGACIPIA